MKLKSKRSLYRFKKIKMMLCEDFGEDSGHEAFKKITQILGEGARTYFPLRLTIPSFHCNENTCSECLKACLAREERNQSINSDFTGVNHQELSEDYNLSERQTRRIMKSHLLQSRIKELLKTLEDVCHSIAEDSREEMIKDLQTLVESWTN